MYSLLDYINYFHYLGQGLVDFNDQPHTNMLSKGGRYGGWGDLHDQSRTQHHPYNFFFNLIL